MWYSCSSRFYLGGGIGKGTVLGTGTGRTSANKILLKKYCEIVVRKTELFFKYVYIYGIIRRF